MTNDVFTIGHSTHPIDVFLGLLQQNRINAIADVRSAPFSRYNPQFNRNDLQNSLKTARVRYVFLGKELGARSDDPSCYKHDKVQYDLLAQTPLFRKGIERVLEGAKSLRVALMCAERDPLECHRTILVSRELQRFGIKVCHIQFDGGIETHPEAIDRLMRTLDIPAQDLFRSRVELEADAYARQAARIAYDRSNKKALPSELDLIVFESDLTE